MVLAKKVEDRDDYAAATRIECNLFHVFYFSKPQALTTFKLPSFLGKIFGRFEIDGVVYGDAVAGACTSWAARRRCDLVTISSHVEHLLQPEYGRWNANTLPSRCSKRYCA